MQIESIHIENQTNLMRDYRAKDPRIMKYFDYTGSRLDFEKRVKELDSRVYKRDKLADILNELNLEWNAPESTLSNIERLRDANSVVVIGGQQAGVLTGPLYSINKVISIIQLARKEEQELNKPVIPVFWIAGEDHDFDEINHVYMQECSKMIKHTVKQRVTDKRSVSQIEAEDTSISNWLADLFEVLHETAYTKDLYSKIKHCLEQSKSYVDFFARLIFQLFQEEGIVLVDSADKRIRKLESDYFINLIDNQKEISEKVFVATQQVKQDGYSISLDVTPNDTHLFYHNNKERILLNKNDDDDWVGKQDEISLTGEEIRTIAIEHPELLSNNVVTRPIMQELLFPTLAFIGGPGEISYWSVLKPAFHVLDIKMPPVVPRLSFTFVERKVEKLLSKYNIHITDAVNHGVEVQKINWLMAQNNPPVSKLASEFKRIIEEAHRPLREVAKSIRSDLGDLAEKNLVYLQRDIEFLEGKVTKALEEKYDKELYEFDMLNNTLRPMGGLQERIWNPLPFINKYGHTFIAELCKQSCSFEKEHYVIYIE